jgi:glucosylceramidase
LKFLKNNSSQINKPIIPNNMIKKLASLLVMVSILASCTTGKKEDQKTVTTAPKKQISTARYFLTAKNTPDRLADKGSISFESLGQPFENDPVILIDPTKTFQEFIGIGGAFTDASAETFYKLPPDKQKEILTAYFDPAAGIGYSFGRTHINSCDFSSSSYTYVKEGDTSLASFSLEPDLKYRIPFIKEALKVSGPMHIFASPWSPPAWMKDNNNMLRGGKLLPQYMSAWSKYYTRFIEEYGKLGVPIWGLTVQNEPMAVQTWESCIYTGEDERDFVKNYLGPQLQKAGMSDIKLMVWDHNRGMMVQRAAAVLDDPEAAKYVWGTAFHWYVGDHFENVGKVHEAYPDKQLVFSEGCNYPFDWKTIEQWQWGENYGRSMINDFNNWTAAWTDWNLILDETGGPNHVNNFCFAPIIGDTRNGSVHYMNSFYYIGHFSKFIRPGAKRISCSSNMDQLLATAFINTGGSIAVVVMNDKETAFDLSLWIAGKASKVKLPEHSIITFVL